MKLSKTQQRLLDELKNDVDVARKYETYKDFFNNSKGEQSYMSTYWNFNGAYNTYEKQLEKLGEEKVLEDTKRFEEFKKGILLTYAKTETINKLEELGYIKVLERNKSGSELVQLINY